MGAFHTLRNAAKASHGVLWERDMTLWGVKGGMLLGSAAEIRWHAELTVDVQYIVVSLETNPCLPLNPQW